MDSGCTWRIFLAAIPFLVLSACKPESGGFVSEEALAPRLLDDRAEMQTYLDAFPYADYEIRDVASVGRFYLDDNPAQVKTTLRRGEPWEPHVIRMLEQYVVPGSTALDVGAHIGSHTLTLARLVGPEGRVYAFEPVKKVFRELVHNIRLNELENVILLRFAVSSEPGLLEMGPIRSADGQVAIGQGGDPAEARTLDSFGFANVSLIKIDVEGHELQVLRGARRTLEAWHPVIVVETIRHADETKALLAEHGYAVQVINPRLGTWHDYVAVYRGQGDLTRPGGEQDPQAAGLKR